MDDLILIGGGGHCKACIDVIESEGKYRIKGILDTPDKIGQTLSGYLYIGTDDDLQHYIDEGSFFLITIGQVSTSKTRQLIAQNLSKRSAKLATVISPRAYIAESAKVLAGTIAMHDSLVNAYAEIGEHCIINSKALIEHDSVIDAFCHISTGAIINGGVKIGEGSFVGSNAVTKQGVSLEPNSFVKAGRSYSGNRKKQTKIALLTTFFPVPEMFVFDFMNSLSTQTYKKFDLIVMNDGYGDTSQIRKQFSNIEIIEIPPAGSIAKNREVLIKFAIANKYDVAIFGDVDDYFSENRVEISVKELLSADIVVNDLTPIYVNKQTERKVIASRLLELPNDIIDYIKDKNIFGLSNTAINLRSIQVEDLNFPDDLVAVDWYFYSNLLLSGMKPVFVSDVITYYRQHALNTVGISDVSEESITNAVRVRLIHYFYMSKKYRSYKNLYDNELKLSKSLRAKDKLEIITRKNQRELKSPLWWEVIE